MKESVLDEALFRHSFLVAVLLYVDYWFLG